MKAEASVWTALGAILNQTELLYQKAFPDFQNSSYEQNCLAIQYSCVDGGEHLGTALSNQISQV